MRGRGETDTGTEGELLGGPHAVLEALRAGRRQVRRILLARQERGGLLDALLAAAQERRVPVEVRPRDDLDRLARGVVHQGVLAEADSYAYWEPEDVLARAMHGVVPGFLLVLDGIQDPQNLGAIVRSAEAAGVHGCILPRDRAAGVSPATVRASAGATEHVPIGRVTNLAAFLGSIQPLGFWVMGTDAAQGRDLFAADLTGPLALVIGGEERGLRALTKSRCDLIVRIPTRGRVASLNASAAAAVCLFEAARQRAAHAGRCADSDPGAPRKDKFAEQETKRGHQG
jgi:23S rRNA (guanosine2251-2'-O)-methyltransferase